MIYIRGALIGFGTVLLGTPIALMIWNFQGGAAMVSFSPVDLAVLVIVLFTAGFLPAVFYPKRCA